MAGHSHAANIMYRKAAVDSKRSKIWGKLARAITVAARMGGGDPDANARLRKALLDARSVSMPKDNIERAVKKGTGEISGEDTVEELIYEGYGPGGVAVMCEILTDNRHRTAPEIRKIFSVNGGELGKSNCIAFLFERKGLIVVSSAQAGEEQLMEIALEAGADDIRQHGNTFEILTSPDKYLAVSEALTAANIQTEASQLTRLPTTTVDLDVDTARQVLKLMEQLDDVQSVAANYNIPEQVLAEVAKGS